jgi:hypothetical protein
MKYRWINFAALSAAPRPHPALQSVAGIAVEISEMGGRTMISTHDVAAPTRAVQAADRQSARAKYPFMLRNSFCISMTRKTVRPQ